MRSSLRDFLVQGVFGPVWDVEALSEIPLEEFRRRYIEDMQNYFDNHNKPTIQCGKCSEEIKSADDLIRYYGANLSRKCFRELYARERDEDNEQGRRYFDLVLDSLDF